MGLDKDIVSTVRGLSDPELALACASHSGEEFHLEGVRKILAGAGLREIEVGSFVPPKLIPAMADTAEIVRYDVFLNHPKHVSLKLLAPDEEELSLREEPYDEDKDSTTEGMFPAFHGYGASG